MKLIVHMIGNAHLDPAWLWTWQAGVDEAVNTCRTACDLLDIYPDFHLTRGEAWVYDQVRQLDPATFARIQGHVAAGRWHIVNGWWIQPDCNFPGEESFRKQAEIGGRFFKTHFGVAVRVGYNVDSFGHCAMLPTFLQSAGMDCYVFMRPQEHEKTLPGNLFRWQSPTGQTVTAFRIAASYNASATSLAGHIDAAIAAADRRVGHTMCFYGVGDHGGGPTRAQIEWIRRHHHYAPDVELRFSHPQALFDAVRASAAELPLVSGELQHHAVGCYSVVRSIKNGVRQGEAALVQAQVLAQAFPQATPPDAEDRLNQAWRPLLFNEFHDILGGSCIQSACEQSVDELGMVRTIARELMVEITRRDMAALHPCPRERLVVYNPSDRPWKGLVEFEPYLPVDGRTKTFFLTDEEHQPVLMQPIAADAACDFTGRIVMAVDVPARGRRTLQLHRREKPLPEHSHLQVDAQTIRNGIVTVTVGATGIAALRLGSRDILSPEGLSVRTFEDLSDTWSHGVNSFTGLPQGTFSARGPWRVRETGPLRAALENELICGEAKLQWTIELAHDSPAITMKLRLYWLGRHQIVKLILPPGFTVRGRRDGTPGIILDRPLDGLEYPIHNVVSVTDEQFSLALVSPDIYAGDVQPNGVIRATLVRSPAYAHHDPYVLPAAHTYPMTDQGMHDYKVLIVPTDAAAAAQIITDEAHRLSSPLHIAETTKGMSPGWRYDASVEALPQERPVASAEALEAWELCAKLVVPASAKLVSGEELAPDWLGEKLLLSKATALAMNWNFTTASRYRITAGYAAGGDFGALELYLDGNLVGTMNHADRGPVGRSSTLTTTAYVPPGSHVVELRRNTGQAIGLAFMECTPLAYDVTGEHWMAVGPFYPPSTGHGTIQDVLENVVFPPEQRRDFTHGVATSDGRSLAWKQMSDCQDYIDFKRLSGAGWGSIHYAATYVWSDRACRLRVRYGIDYFLRMWVNSEMVLPFMQGSGAARKGQLAVEVGLNAGWNEFLLKVGAGSAGNGFWFSSADAEGLRWAAAPDAGGPASKT